MAKYDGNLNDLQALVLSLGHEGDWSPVANSIWRFIRRRDRAGMNWSETKGTVWFDGPGPAKADLQQSIEGALASAGGQKDFDPAGKTIFVVHGRDHLSRDQLQWHRAPDEVGRRPSEKLQ